MKQQKLIGKAVGTIIPAAVNGKASVMTSEEKIEVLRTVLEQGLAFLENDAVAGPDGQPLLSQQEFDRLMDAWGEAVHKALKDTA